MFFASGGSPLDRNLNLLRESVLPDAVNSLSLAFPGAREVGGMINPHDGFHLLPQPVLTDSASERVRLLHVALPFGAPFDPARLLDDVHEKDINNPRCQCAWLCITAPNQSFDLEAP